jgi:hypothetical protein
MEEIARVVDMVELYAQNPLRTQDPIADRDDFKRLTHSLAMRQVAYSHIYALNDKFRSNPQSK